MKTRMESLHPLSLFIYMTVILGLSMTTRNPWLLCLSFLGSVMIHVTLRQPGFLRSLLKLLVLLVLISLLNPVLNHNGRTPLFFLNGQAYTLEALLYGVVSGVMIVAVLLWCKALPILFPSDKVLYLFRRISKKAALMISMILRILPVIKRTYKQYGVIQNQLGLYGDLSMMEKFRGGAYTLSGTTTWALEHSMDTADSMKARGYGRGKATSAMEYPFRRGDGIVMVLTLVLGGCVFAGLFLGVFTMEFYPGIILPNSTSLDLVYYCCFGILALLLPIYELFEEIRWNYLQSRI